MCRRARCSASSPSVRRRMHRRIVVSPPPLWLAQQLDAPALEELIDERAPAVGAEERTRGVATLRAQSRCPFRGFAETRLDAVRPGAAHARLQRARARTDSARGAAGIIHRGARFAQSRGSHRTARGERGADRRACAPRGREAVRKARSRRALGGARARAACRGCSSAGSSWNRCARPFKWSTSREAARPPFTRGLAYTVRIDRIDRLEDGSRVLIDYKTGWVTQDWRGRTAGQPAAAHVRAVAS